ncbi:VWA domain-containing protein [Sulfodiicoccus acidiphilus]|nr:VWA domain-containing protein [Sulfodiicoccus acidiphilus]
MKLSISLSLETSHRHPYTQDVAMKFRLNVVPEKVVPTNDMHYMVLLDVSGSMEGVKLETAKKGVESLLAKIPEGNRATILTFSDDVRTVANFEEPRNVNLEFKAGGGTQLYAALRTAYAKFRERGKPGYMILLTDGKPTDVHESEAYSKIEVPSSLTVYAFGVGEDYNESILKSVVDSCGGKLYHLEDPETISQELPKATVTYVAAKDLTVEFRWPREVKILNYQGPPVRISAVQEVVKIYGETVLPANASGESLKAVVSYRDPTDGSVRIEEESVRLDDGDFLSGLNKDLMREYRYYELLKKYGDEVMTGELDQATKTLDMMKKVAEETRRVELVEATRRLTRSFESTRRLESTKRTSRLSKEVASEVTKALR